MIDISQAQKPFDWQRVKAEGVGGVIIRATQGVADSQPVGVDTSFLTHLQGATAAGLKVGAYHVYIASRDGNAQAQFFHDTISPFMDKLTLPLAIDVELDNAQTAEVITGRLFDLVHTLQALGHPLPLIYTSPGFWNKHILPRHDDYFSQCPLWVAHWTNAEQPLLPRGWASYALWQYGKLVVAGQNVDINRLPPIASASQFIVPAKFPYVQPNGGAFDAPRNYDFAPARKQLHEGADFAPLPTAVAPYPVIAPAAGEVVKTGFDARGYGNYIKIKHADGFTSWLAHLKEPALVSSGTVTQGQLVGYAGSTGGTSTGVHLHWTLQREGVGLDNYVVADVVDPIPYVKAA